MKLWVLVLISFGLILNGCKKEPDKSEDIVFKICPVDTGAIAEASSYLYGANQLAFVYDMYNASVIAISCGGTLEAAPFNYRVIGNTPDPVSVTMPSGLNKYQLDSPFFDCTMLVQMLTDRTIQVEVFLDKLPSEVTGFTSGSIIYLR